MRRSFQFFSSSCASFPAASSCFSSSCRLMTGSASSSSSSSSSSTPPASSSSSSSSSCGEKEVFFFNKWEIHPSQVFFSGKHCFGLINLKPIVPGHVLIVSKRVVPRLSDLPSEEAADLFKCVHEIAPVVERRYGASALNIAVQDGKIAGQSVPHVHVHILPRKACDFPNNDDIYEELDDHRVEEAIIEKRDPETNLERAVDDHLVAADIDFKRERKPRTLEDMAMESNMLRRTLSQNGIISIS